MTGTIAQVAGPYLLVTGLGFILSPAFYRRMIASQHKADPVLLNLSGATHFVVGMIILVDHFIWDTLLASVVTLLGLGAVLKGIGLIVFPYLTVQSPSVNHKGLYVTAAVFLLTGG